MHLCSGGILGMGESLRQRVEFAFELRALDPMEVPVNFLDPRPGTPLAGMTLMKPKDAVKTIAIFRLVMPEVLLRYAGGREVVLRELQAYGLVAGINGLIVGNYLTTLGRPPEEDLRLLDDLGRPAVSQKVIAQRIEREKRLRAHEGRVEPIVEEPKTSEAVVLVEPGKRVRFIPPGVGASARRRET